MDIKKAGLFTCLFQALYEENQNKQQVIKLFKSKIKIKESYNFFTFQ